MNLCTLTMLTIAAIASATPAMADNKPAVVDKDVQAVATGNAQFALDLYAQLREKDGNLFFSPFSISTALAMTYAGARGDTAKEMADVLHFPGNVEDLHKTFAGLLAALESSPDNKGCTLRIANALWLSQGSSFLDAFLQIGRKQYNAALETVDFGAGVKQTCQKINTWVEEHTAHKIKNLVGEGDIHGAELVLTNAIYFKGSWLTEFDPEKTGDAPFTRADGSKIEVPLMTRTGPIDYAEFPTFQMAALPYVGETVQMVVLLPKAPDGLPDLERQLDAKHLTEWLGKLRGDKVELYLPRFKMKVKYYLLKDLMKLGMRLASDATKADLSGLTGSLGRYIGEVIHEAYVDVNEEGTEAAAATAVVIRATAMPKPPPVFRADHPFIFLIRDTKTDSILFLGRLTDPPTDAG